MRDFLFELELERPSKGARSAAATVHRQLRAAILDGRLPPGASLPPSRYARGIFGVSRNTLVAVYEQLLHEGCVVTRRGSGTCVADAPPGKFSQPESAVPIAGGRLNAFWLRPETKQGLGFWRVDADGGPSESSRDWIDLRPAVVDRSMFPHKVFRQAMVRELRRLELAPTPLRSQEGDAGNPRLRAAISQHIAVTRAISCQPDEVIVTSGAQQAFDLLARTLVSQPGALVAVEDPGYPPMRLAFAAAGARLVGVPVDGEGMMIDELPPNVDVVCVCPSHQFPLGAPLSQARRRGLIAFARRRGAAVVEDDYDGEFRHDGGPLAALRAQDADVVFHVGTFSKSMLPDLRLGFVVAPSWARAALVASKNCLDWETSAPIQAAVAAFIDEGHLTRHLRRMRHVYARRRAFLMRALREDFADRLAPIRGAYGVHLTADLVPGGDAEAIVDALALKGVKIHSLDHYAFERPARPALIVGYGVSDEPALGRALDAMSEVLR